MPFHKPGCSLIPNSTPGSGLQTRLGKNPLQGVEKLPCSPTAQEPRDTGLLSSVCLSFSFSGLSNLKMEKNNERPMLGNQVEKIYIKAKCEGSKLQHRENGGCSRRGPSSASLGSWQKGRKGERQEGGWGRPWALWGHTVTHTHRHTHGVLTPYPPSLFSPALSKVRPSPHTCSQERELFRGISDQHGVTFAFNQERSPGLRKRRRAADSRKQSCG